MPKSNLPAPGFLFHRTIWRSPDSTTILLFNRRGYSDANTGSLVRLSGEVHPLDRFPPTATQIQWAGNRMEFFPPAFFGLGYRESFPKGGIFGGRLGATMGGGLSLHTIMEPS